ncbi:unnamed protein product [Euphydryas editha]|uniref:Aryl hydrocarbon receptor n=1 Tax=Euphydryas editha TaxID=104508 RepID=A0AAU9TL67_EUPED|nr:unnamed protein product [Euphydryas editha]
MTLVNEDMSNILEYLSRNDQDYDEVNPKVEKMDNFQQDRLLSDSWQASDDFLENILSLEQGSLNFLEESLPDLNLTADNASQPEGLSSSCSDSGLSSDPAEL